MKVLEITQWITNFVYLNILFILGVFLGLGIFGLYPSFYATIVVSRKILYGFDEKIFQDFVQVYKDNFLISLKIGYIHLSFILVAFSNVIFWTQIQETSFSYVLRIAWLFILIMLLSGSLLSFPIAVGARMKWKDMSKLFLFSFSQIHLHILLFIGILVIYLATLSFPGIFIFFAGSISLTWIMFMSQIFIGKIKKIQKGSEE